MVTTKHTPSSSRKQKLHNYKNNSLKIIRKYVKWVRLVTPMVMYNKSFIILEEIKQCINLSK